MAVPVIAQRPRFLPGSAQLDRGHPLAAGLNLFAVPGLGRDLFTGADMTVGGTTKAASPQGLGASGWSTSAYWKVGDGAGVGNLSNFTILAYVRNSTTQASGFLGNSIYSERGSSGQDILALATFFATNGWRIQYRNDAGVLLNTSSTTGLTAGQYYSIGTTRSSNTTFETWLDGARDGTFTSGTMTAAFTNATLDRRVGAQQASANSHFTDGTIVWVATWTRTLSAGEIAAMHADPFQMFRY